MSTTPDLLRWDPDPASRSVSRDRIEAIAFTPMPERLRNELITRTYGDLADAMAELLGTNDATWVGFGQWASATIGGYLTSPVPILGRLVTQAFGDGNRDVFADIARAHTTFLDTVGRAHLDGGDLDEAWRRCERELRRRLFSPPGGPGGGTVEEFWADTLDPRSKPDGPRYNQLLVLAFRAYRRALEAPDSEARSRHILLGNCLIGAHEQRLLGLAISIGFRSWLRTVAAPWRLAEARGPWLTRTPGRLQLALEHRWIRFATRWLIGVQLPTGTAKVGRPVPVGERPLALPDSEPEQRRRTRGRSPERGPGPGRNPGRDERPILELDDDELLAQLGDRFGIDGRAAVCWNDFRDRMAYIGALFAAHQRNGSWFDSHGRVVRPPAWEELDAQLADLTGRISLPAPPPAATSTPSPLSDAQLDELRARPTHLPPSDGPPLRFAQVADPAHQARFKVIAADIAARHALVTGPGGLLDPATCREARQMFSGRGSVWFMGLLFRSLPDSYAAAAGAHVLGRVSDLATDPFRRAGETAQFVLDLLARPAGWDDGVLAPNGSAYRSVLGVRIMHALVAAELMADGWDADLLGLPVNAEDALGAALSFAVPPLELLDALGIDVDGNRRDAFVRFWLGIGVLLGVPHEATTTAGADGRRKPLDYDQARALALTIRRRHHARSLDGVRLTEAILGGVADGFPRSLEWLPAALLEVLGDERVTGPLLVEPRTGRRRAAVVVAGFRFLLRFRPLRPVGRALVRLVGRRVVQPFLEQGRTRPYRRPRQADDDHRTVIGPSAESWPLSCSTSAQGDQPG